jgi:hypothetical protein
VTAGRPGSLGVGSVIRGGECVAVGDETAALCDEQDGCAGGLAQPAQNRPHGGLGEQAGGQGEGSAANCNHGYALDDASRQGRLMDSVAVNGEQISWDDGLRSEFRAVPSAVSARR